ncbi:MAG: DUF4411 family protein [Thermaerobacter sp.]|nr:DUF4411 family protein [Thermaerobacter sp.]
MSGLYILDASVFIQAHRQPYPFDVAPAFWDALLYCARRHCLVSFDAVDRELTGNDQLSQWARVHKDDLFRSTDILEVVAAYRDVMAWVTQNSQHVEAAKAAFAGGADAWVIAFTIPYGHAIVTQEVSSPLSRTKVKIPYVCSAMNVDAIDTVQPFK